MAEVLQNAVNFCGSSVKHESGLPRKANKVLTFAMAMGSAILVILTNGPVALPPPTHPASVSARATATILRAERIILSSAPPPRMSNIANEMRRLIEFE